MDDAIVTSLGADVHAIDTMVAGQPGVTAAYMITSSAPCLVETGTAISAPLVRRALLGLGVGQRDLATVVVTHIHLDHAGGVGHLARSFPKARIVVHPAGASHLVDPRRLMRSAARVFPATVLDRVLGVLAPTPEERITAAENDALVHLGDGRSLRAIESPGHARHHHGLLDDATGDLYVGDAAGLWFAATEEVRPATPPPDFDLSTALASLRAFAATSPTRLLFSHYGAADDATGVLRQAADRLVAAVAEVRALRAAGHPQEHVVDLVRTRERRSYRAFAADPAYAEAVTTISSPAANVAGVWYFDSTAEAIG